MPPTGTKIDDGFSTTVNFSGAPNAALWEKEITPPSISGGGANDTTTMRNVAWRTKAPKKLKTLGECSGTCAYDPAVYNSILSLVNANQSIQLDFANGAHLTFFGWLDDFKPNACKEGDQPTAAFTVICSNQDTMGDEIAPVFAAAS